MVENTLFTLKHDQQQQEPIHKRLNTSSSTTRTSITINSSGNKNNENLQIQNPNVLPQDEELYEDLTIFDKPKSNLLLKQEHQMDDIYSNYSNNNIYNNYDNYDNENLNLTIKQYNIFSIKNVFFILLTYYLFICVKFHNNLLIYPNSISNLYLFFKDIFLTPIYNYGIPKDFNIIILLSLSNIINLLNLFNYNLYLNWLLNLSSILILHFTKIFPITEFYEHYISLFTVFILLNNFIKIKEFNQYNLFSILSISILFKYYQLNDFTLLGNLNIIYNLLICNFAFLNNIKLSLNRLVFLNTLNLLNLNLNEINILSISIFLIGYYIWTISNLQYKYFKNYISFNNTLNNNEITSFPYFLFNSTKTPRFISSKDGNYILADSGWLTCRNIDLFGELLMLFSIFILNINVISFIVFICNVVDIINLENERNDLNMKNRDYIKYCNVVPFRIIPFIY